MSKGQNHKIASVVRSCQNNQVSESNGLREKIIWRQQDRSLCPSHNNSGNLFCYLVEDLRPCMHWKETIFYFCLPYFICLLGSLWLVDNPADHFCHYGQIVLGFDGLFWIREHSCGNSKRTPPRKKIDFFRALPKLPPPPPSPNSGKLYNFFWTSKTTFWEAIIHEKKIFCEITS